MRQVKRRQFLIAAGALATVPLVHAQAPKAGHPRRIGLLSLSAEPKGRVSWVKSVTSGRFRELGWIEGENLLIERTYAGRSADRLQALAEELVRKQVELIWTFSSEAALAAARATRSIPVVFFDPPYPVEQGLVDSLARPGRNVTGTTFLTDSKIVDKNFELLREIAPTTRRILQFIEPAAAAKLNGGHIDFRSRYEPVIKRFGFELEIREIRKLQDIETVLSEIKTPRPEAIRVGGGYLLFAGRKLIIEFALRSRLPSAFFSRFYVEAGGLFSYGIAQTESEAMLLRNVDYIDRILRGANPSELPVERPSRFELVINAQTAKALGLTIPQSLLLRADRVIE